MFLMWLTIYVSRCTCTLSSMHVAWSLWLLVVVNYGHFGYSWQLSIRNAAMLFCRKIYHLSHKNGKSECICQSCPSKLPWLSLDRWLVERASCLSAIFHLYRTGCGVNTTGCTGDGTNDHCDLLWLVCISISMTLFICYTYISKATMATLPTSS